MASEKRKKDWNSYPMGALREAAPIAAPKLQLKAGGVERKVDLRKHCSPIEDQQLLGSCNACSLVGALEYFYRREHDRKIDLSVLFLFYNARRLSRTETQNIGVLTAHAMAGLMGFGVCEDRLWPYKADKHVEEPPAECYANAKRYEAVQYARVGSYDETKVLLSAGVPVTVGCFIPRWYYNEAATSGVMPPLRDRTEDPGGGHSMLLVGYDDDAQVWIVRNSWGEDYGEKGYVRISYGLMQNYLWHEDLWAVGALEKLQNARLFGATMEEATRSVAHEAPGQHAAALERLKEDLRREMSRDVDAAKEDFRKRVYAAVEQQRRFAPGGVMGNATYPGETEQDASHRKFIDAMLGGYASGQSPGAVVGAHDGEGDGSRLGSLRDSLRRELGDTTDDAARGFRSRLRKQEDEIAGKPPRGGGDQGR